MNKPVIIYTVGDSGESPHIVNQMLEMDIYSLELIREAVLIVETNALIEGDTAKEVAYFEIRYRIEVEIYRRKLGLSTYHNN